MRFHTNVADSRGRPVWS